MKNKFLETIILIGPCGSGKSTIGKLLAQKTSKKFYNLDEYEPNYALEVGFNAEQAQQIKDKKGFLNYYEYCRQFFDHGVSRFLNEFPGSILEFGGGHPIVPNPDKQAQIKAELKPYKYVFLILPTPNIKKSLDILWIRNETTPEYDLNSLFFPDKSFSEIAKFTVYTEGKTPEQTAEEILKQIY